MEMGFLNSKKKEVQNACKVEKRTPRAKHLQSALPVLSLAEMNSEDTITLSEKRRDKNKTKLPDSGPKLFRQSTSPANFCSQKQTTQPVVSKIMHP